MSEHEHTTLRDLIVKRVIRLISIALPHLSGRSRNGRRRRRRTGECSLRRSFITEMITGGSSM
jgi:hypothetical protein